MIPEIHIEDFNYDLPDSRIAKYPLEKRDSSKLLVYTPAPAKGRVEDRVFTDLPSLLPEGAMMVFNDTKVVPARLHFCRETGAHIEVFCLEPVLPAEYNQIFAATSLCRWKCVIGNAKRWKDDVLSLYNPDSDPIIAAMDLRATLVSRDGQTGVVEFTWKGGALFSNILDSCGRVPIPPYLNRDTEALDLERYQTTYARLRGSVAAPTAGLHFTPEVIADIERRGIDKRNVCLHVGAGTFLPVKTSNVADHPMHREPFSVSRDLLCELAAAVSGSGDASGDIAAAAGISAPSAKRPVVAVGTTSVRTLESLYYAGVSIIEKGSAEDVDQWCPYTRDYHYSTEESLQAIVKYLDAHGLSELKVGTRIIIVPGFRFRIVDGLVTNFHQPQSTLLLLISAFVGGDWRTIYDHALAGGYRFLSYGDSSYLRRG